MTGFEAEEWRISFVIENPHPDGPAEWSSEAGKVLERKEAGPSNPFSEVTLKTCC